MKSRKIYILMGNPDKEGTLSNELADTYEREARTAGHEVRRANISDLSFDPILHKGYKVIQDLEPDLKTALDNLKWADHFVLIYPLWWSATPAMLKGFFDRAWLPGFCFHFHKNDPGWDKLMKGKTAHVITLSKMPPLAIRFMFGDFTNEIRHATLGFAGFKVRMSEFGNSENLSDAQRRRVNARIVRLAKRGK